MPQAFTAISVRKFAFATFGGEFLVIPRYTGDDTTSNEKVTNANFPHIVVTMRIRVHGHSGDPVENLKDLESIIYM